MALVHTVNGIRRVPVATSGAREAVSYDLTSAQVYLRSSGPIVARVYLIQALSGRVSVRIVHGSAVAYLLFPTRVRMCSEIQTPTPDWTLVVRHT
jgi:hypothetical protein